jgi:regulator of sigma E protease
MTLLVERLEAGKPTSSKVEVKITPDNSPAWGDPFDPFGRLVPLDVPGLGLSLSIEPKILEVTQGSPAARAGLKVGDTLRSIILTARKMEDEKAKPKPNTIKLDGPVSGWPHAFVAIQQIPMDSIELTTDKSDKPIQITPEVDPLRFHPVRGLIFQALIRKLPPLGLADAFNRGFEETVSNVFSIFQIFRGLYQGRVGGDAFGGVISIGQIAYSSASMGWTPFIHFLGMLSINLAVLNFLPIPPLDGGQFTILTAEKVRGKPLPESALNLVTIAGLVFVLALILLVNGKDVYKLILSYF